MEKCLKADYSQRPSIEVIVGSINTEIEQLNNETVLGSGPGGKSLMMKSESHAEQLIKSTLYEIAGHPIEEACWGGQREQM